MCVAMISHLALSSAILAVVDSLASYIKAYKTELSCPCPITAAYSLDDFAECLLWSKDE